MGTIEVGHWTITYDHGGRVTKVQSNNSGFEVDPAVWVAIAGLLNEDIADGIAPREPERWARILEEPGEGNTSNAVSYLAHLWNSVLDRPPKEQRQRIARRILYRTEPAGG